MGFNPLDEKGIPIEQHFKNWAELTAYQYDKNSVDPYTRCRVITANGAEIEGAFYSHHFARHCDDYGIKQKLCMTRRVEQQQQKMVAGCVPGNETSLEHTIGYEQVAVDLTAFLAQNVKDDYVKAAMDFGLLEDFDHLYRYANALEMLEGRKAEDILGKQTEVTVGRPTIFEHRHPFDEIRKPYDSADTDFATQIHTMILTAAEQQTMNFYMNVANRATDKLMRGLWTEIGMIEEQHVSHYESLMDPNCSWGMCLVMHEYAEAYLYWSFMQQETDPKIKQMWETYMNMEIAHLHQAIDIMRQMEDKDAREMLPAGFPAPIMFQSQIEYVRRILGSQAGLTAKDMNFILVEKLPQDHRYYKYQSKVNSGGFVPTQEVIQEHIDQKGQDYRFETSPNPVQAFQERKKVVGMEEYKKAA